MVYDMRFSDWIKNQQTVTLDHMFNHESWLNSVKGNDSMHEVKRKTGVNNSSLSRRLDKGQGLTADHVISIAQGYSLDPVQALRDTGYLPQHPQEETPEQLAERIKADVDRLAAKAGQSNIIPMPAKSTPDVADDFYNQETPTGFPFEEAVAKDSEDLDSWEEDDNTP